MICDSVFRELGNIIFDIYTMISLKIGAVRVHNIDWYLRVIKGLARNIAHALRITSSRNVDALQNVALQHKVFLQFSERRRCREG